MQTKTFFLAVTAWICLLIGMSHGIQPPTIDLSGFQDIIKHWNDKYGRDRDDLSLDSSQFVEIADRIVAFQLPDGGWPKSFNPVLNVPKAELRTLLGRSLDRSTLDNRTTYTHIDYLAKVYSVCSAERFRVSAERGLDYIFNEQRPTGGWRGADVDAITYNDDVMLGVMKLLRDINRDQVQFNWLDSERRRQAASALKRAIDVTLKCQIEVNGLKTGWCQQHSHETFLPVKARSYELPAICPVETSGIVRFLMATDHPSPEVMDAIESAVRWIDRSAIAGQRVEEIDIPPTRFEGHTATRDRIVVEDPTAPPIWTRYYEIETNRPFFCNRDGTIVYSLAEVHPERRTGYGWYSAAPARLLENDYPAWKSRLATFRKASAFSDDQLEVIREQFGTRRDSYLKGYLEKPFVDLDPAIEESGKRLAKAKWIWDRAPDEKGNMPIARINFRRELAVPAGKRIESAYVLVAADNTCNVMLNGTKAGSSSGFQQANPIEITSRLQSGTNVVSLTVENLGDEPNPGGVLGAVYVKFEDGDTLDLVTDENWRLSSEEPEGWQTSSFDDRHWQQAHVLGPLGIAPWGSVTIQLDVVVSQYVFRRLTFALSALYLQTDIERANGAIVDAVDAMRRQQQATGEFGLHWTGGAFYRIYGLFGPNGTMKERLSEKASAAIWQLFADWARADSLIAEADPEHTWRIWGSENHSAQRDATRWAAANMIASDPRGKDFVYDDGSTAAEQLQAWQIFLKRYFRERIKRGMLIEISPSGYGSRTLQGWHNIIDFTTDMELKSVAKSALDVWWAEWAQEQLGGMRGGGKTRLYPGAYALASHDRNRAMSWFYLGQGKPAHYHETLPVIATTEYRLPLVVMDIALDTAGRGVYECRSRRLGRHSDYELSQSLSKPNEPVDDVDSEYGGIVRYSYCTPDFIAGCLMLENRPTEYWTGISQQNRWHGVIFAGAENSTLYPRCESDHATYNAHWAIQNKGTLIAQKLRSSESTDAMRVCFSTDLQRSETAGWIFAKAATAFAAVKIVNGDWTWDDERWLRCGDEYTPVIIEVVRSSDYPDGFESFQQAVLSQTFNFDEGILRYQGLQGSGDFTFFANSERLPELDGLPIDLAPDYAFKSPFLNEAWASGVVRITKGQRELVVDVSE
ncbi:MAG: pectate lyase [Pirellulaceae bacterium]